MAFLLDANTFIAAKNLYYRFTFCPAFWELLLKGNSTGNIFCIDKVKDEIVVGTDELAGWMRTNSTSLVLNATPNLPASLSVVASWVNTNPHYTPAAKSTFFGIADFYLVAYAHATQNVVVTNEQPRPNARNRVFIPDVCAGLGVECITTFEMLERIGSKMVCQ